MTLRRPLAVLAALPLALYVYACSDDDPVTSDDQDAGSETPDTGGGKADSGGAPVDESDAGDTGDGGLPVECLGNPLTADGGTVDGGAIVAIDELRQIATGLFLDGPQWLDEGDAGAGGIVYSEVFSQAIVRNAPDGGERVVLGQTGADLPIGNGQSGAFLYTTVATTSGRGLIRKMQLDGGAPQSVDAGVARSPNDLVTSSKGFVYFTDPGYQAVEENPVTGVYRLAPNGAITAVAQFNNGANPGARADGIALSRDERTLFVGFSDIKEITTYAVAENGDTSNPQKFAFTPTDNPTGLAVDVAGNLWIAENDAVAVRGRIEVVDPTGKKWGEIAFPDSRPTGIAFGGSDGKTVYVTTERGEAAGSLYVFGARCPGVR